MVQEERVIRFNCWCGQPDCHIFNNRTTTIWSTANICNVVSKKYVDDLVNLRAVVSRLVTLGWVKRFADGE